MTKRQRDKLNRLCRDLPALARHLALPADPLWQREQATLDACEAQAESMTPKDRERWIAANERNRWRVAEGMLWLAAWGEQGARREADIAAGKIREVRASVGLPWKPATRLVRKTVGMKWGMRLSDLFDHEAVRAAMPADLHAILRKVFAAFLAERKELDELRANPDPVRVKAWRERNDGEGVPGDVQGIVTEFQSFIDEQRRKAKAETATPGIQAKLAADPKQAAKREARALWDKWQAGEVHFKSIAAWAEACCERFGLEDQKNVEGWHRAWKKGTGTNRK